MAIQDNDTSKDVVGVKDASAASPGPSTTATISVTPPEPTPTPTQPLAQPPAHTQSTSDDHTPHNHAHLDVPSSSSSADLERDAVVDERASRGSGSSINRKPDDAESRSRSKSRSRNLSDDDAESASNVASTSRLQPDPFQLRDGMLSEGQLEGLRQRKTDGGKALERYHLRQNNLIPALLTPMDELTEDARVAENASRLPVKIAVYASLYCNLGLCILQLYAALSSLSLSLIATGIDSLFDIGSNVLLFYLHRKAAKLDVNKWPVGGARLESVGNIVYGFLMGAVNLIVIIESVRTLISKKGDELRPFHLASIIAVGVALGVKFLLFLYCYPLRNKSSQVRMLWSDHRNDLFLNGFGIVMSAGGSKLKWWLDPMGAIIIGSGVIIAWGRTIYRQFELLAGKSAPHDFLQLLTYKVATFSGDVDRVDTVRAYHSGPNYFVEVDIVMDGVTPLWKAHDISQHLQDKIEVLPHVERAFVHVDYESEHVPEHRKPKAPRETK